MAAEGSWGVGLGRDGTLTRMADAPRCAGRVGQGGLQRAPTAAAGAMGSVPHPDRASAKPQVVETKKHFEGSLRRSPLPPWGPGEMTLELSHPLVYPPVSPGSPRFPPVQSGFISFSPEAAGTRLGLRKQMQNHSDDSYQRAAGRIQQLESPELRRRFALAFWLSRYVDKSVPGRSEESRGTSRRRGTVTPKLLPVDDICTICGVDKEKATEYKVFLLRPDAENWLASREITHSLTKYTGEQFLQQFGRRVARIGKKPLVFTYGQVLHIKNSVNGTKFPASLVEELPCLMRYIDAPDDGVIDGTLFSVFSPATLREKLKGIVRSDAPMTREALSEALLQLDDSCFEGHFLGF